MKDRHIESRQRLLHIEQAIADIERFTKNETLESFCKNDILHDAVMMQFIIIGEAIIHVENEKLDKYDYPWYKVKSFRNMIAHEYFNIKLPAVWQIIENDLQQLKQTVQVILTKEF
ncbi:MAG: HepT-like ribonuclease domain-containing protein [Chitinophagaceae bacterium]|nr:HepT-like ribonuclease domain-containing protein [Chitinophagaceae bacterium]